MSVHDAAAATECIRLIALLTDAMTPHARELATLVAGRLVAIIDQGAGEPMNEREIDGWISVARVCLEQQKAKGWDDDR